MEKYLAVLKKCPLFYGIEGADMLRMLNCLGARKLFFDKKYTVFSEGTAAKYVGIVLSGSVMITQNDYYGNRSIVAEISEGGLFCEEFACSQTKSIPVEVVANEPSEIMLIDASHMMHTCQNVCAFHQSLIFNMMKGLAEKTVAFHRRIEVTSKRTTRDKLLSYLMIESQRFGKNEFDVPFDRQALADYLEVERSGLSAEISKLRAEGILESRKNHFKLL